MKKLLAACASVARAQARFLRGALRKAFAWLSLPVNACLAAIVLAFLISLFSWAIGDRYAEMALFFPSGKASASGLATLKAELRDLPRPRGAEARAELLASELLLGPRDPLLGPAFPQGTRLESALYRKGHLYVDLSASAALAEASALKAGLSALERSLRLALPGLKGLRVTIGGREPYVESIMAGNSVKKQKNN
jgi:hypothetical protein